MEFRLERMPPSLTMRPTTGQLRKEQFMKTKLLSKLLVSAVMATGALTQAKAQPCSNASLQGTYGFHAFASIVSPGNPATPRAILGVFTLDGRGNWTANLTLDDNGTITPRPNEGGTYVVNADCTGTLLPNSGGSVALVVVSGGSEFYQMRTSPASIVVFGTTKKVSSGNNQGNQGN
jgi:hypothetical protein